VRFTLGAGTARVNPIHGADLAEFIADHLTAPPGAWDVGGPETFSYRELEELAFRVAGRRPRVLRLGRGVTRPLLWAADRSSPRLGNLTRFFVESLELDAVGAPTGERRLEPFLRSLP